MVVPDLNVLRRRSKSQLLVEDGEDFKFNGGRMIVKAMDRIFMERVIHFEQFSWVQNPPSTMIIFLVQRNSLQMRKKIDDLQATGL